MRAIDTNVLVRLLVRDDAEQAGQADACVASNVWLSHVALAETIWVLRSSFKHSRAAIGAAVEMLLGHETISIQEDDVVAAALQLYRSQSRADFTDCLILEIARKAGHGPMSTFDRAFAKLDGVEQL